MKLSVIAAVAHGGVIGRALQEGERNCRGLREHLCEHHFPPLYPECQ